MSRGSLKHAQKILEQLDPWSELQFSPLDEAYANELHRFHKNLKQSVSHQDDAEIQKILTQLDKFWHLVGASAQANIIDLLPK